MSPIAQHIQTWNTCTALIYSAVPDVQTLPAEKRKFYENVLNALQAAKEIIDAKQRQVEWLEQYNEKTKEQSYVILKKQFNSLLTLARCRGVDVELLRFVD